MGDKFKNTAQPSRLSNLNQGATGFSSPKKKSMPPRGFRLGPDLIADLEQITKSVNGISKRKITDSDVVRALIHYGANHMKTEQILKAFKDSM